MDINNCTIEATAQLIDPLPIIADFSFPADTVSLVDGEVVVSFTNNSTAGSSFGWDFGEGSSSNASNPVFTYTTEGTYNVALMATSTNGCLGYLEQSIVVLAEVTGIESQQNTQQLNVISMQQGILIQNTGTTNLENLKLTLYNSIGQKVYGGEQSIDANSQIVVPMQTTSFGVYIIQVETGEKTMSYKLIR